MPWSSCQQLQSNVFRRNQTLWQTSGNLAANGPVVAQLLSDSPSGWAAAIERRLYGHDTAGKTMRGGHSRRGDVIGARYLLLTSELLAR